MTVMFDRFFGVPQSVMRNRIWADMKPAEQSLYICLMHESERYRSRLLRRNDEGLSGLAGLSSRALTNARKKLQERGLLLCKRGSGNVYIYEICNPETRIPWPGDPRERVRYTKAQRDNTNLKGPVGGDYAPPSWDTFGNQASLVTEGDPKKPTGRELLEYGLPLKF